jgi:hypothetical protein
MIRLVIKGDIYQARAALDARKLQTTCMLLDAGHGCIDTMVHGSDLEAVVAWFVEPVRAAKGEGFPAGSLLFYSQEPKP